MCPFVCFIINVRSKNMNYLQACVVIMVPQIPLQTPLKQTYITEVDGAYWFKI